MQRTTTTHSKEPGRTSDVAIPDIIATQEWIVMLSWALVFLVLALVAAAFGFGGIAGTATSIAQLLFIVFLVLTVVAFVVRALSGRSVT
jgi:uncharacterized membrane protein YtjA (UPF0391 family)